jgi:hypothetical protein
MRLAKDAPKEAELILFEAWEMMFKTRDTLLSHGWNSHSAQGVMSIVRLFHKSRVAKKVCGCTSGRSQERNQRAD